MSDESIEGLARKLAEAVPQGLRSVGEDLEQNFRAVLRSGLDKLDLVTREEFAVQEAVLARTREKLDAMEARLEMLGNPPVAKKPVARKAASKGSKKTGTKTGKKTGKTTAKRTTKKT